MHAPTKVGSAASHDRTTLESSGAFPVSSHSCCGEVVVLFAQSKASVPGTRPIDRTTAVSRWPDLKNHQNASKICGNVAARSFLS